MAAYPQPVIIAQQPAQNCMGCGQFLPFGANVCPFCGRPVGMMTGPQPVFMAGPQPMMPMPMMYQMGPRKTGIGTAGGVLTIIAAVFVLIYSFVYIFAAIIIGAYSSYSGIYFGGFIYLIFAAIFGFVGFSLGLAGAVCTFRRKSFAIAVVGTILCFAAACIQLNIISIIIGILGMIFTIIAKNEFM